MSGRLLGFEFAGDDDVLVNFFLDALFVPRGQMEIHPHRQMQQKGKQLHTKIIKHKNG